MAETIKAFVVVHLAKNDADYNRMAYAVILETSREKAVKKLKNLVGVSRYLEMRMDEVPLVVE